MTRSDPRARETRRDPERVLRGIGVSPGIVEGAVISTASEAPEVTQREIAPHQVEAELERFRRAVRDVVTEISVLKADVVDELGEAAEIFDAQLMILRDPLAIDATERDVRSRHESAAQAFRENMLRVLARFDAMQDGPFKDRAADIRDVKRRVLRRLLGTEDETARSLPGTIAVAREFTPSDTVHLAEAGVVALAAERGGVTAHAAIMARARGLPAVMGVPQLRRRARSATRAIVDGWRGEVVLDPTEDEIAHYRRLREHNLRLLKRLELLRDLPSVTPDGREIQLHANVELPQEIETLAGHGASGVGLFRTEFFLLRRSRFPDEAEQLEVFMSAVRALAPRPLVIRTMDLGGDKLTSFLGTDRERNPFLGFRGIRFLLDHDDVFRTHLRAILRASAFGPVRVLLPMVTTPEELREAKAQLRAAMDELTAAGVAFDRHLPVGVMIETPAAVLMADHLARECDFFSIGSNDLTQYTLAVDRTNARLSYLFNELHPSVLRAIRDTIHAAHREGCSVSLCGEMAGDTWATALLVGLGVDSLSMSPLRIPEIKEIVRHVTYDEAREVAARAIRRSTVGEVEQLIRDFMTAKFPELAELRRPVGGGGLVS